MSRVLLFSVIATILMLSGITIFSYSIAVRAGYGIVLGLVLITISSYSIIFAVRSRESYSQENLIN